MLFDLWFLGLPIGATIALINLAIKEGDMKFWKCGLSFTAYIAFYLAGGREVILYITCGLILSHGWVAAGPL